MAVIAVVALVVVGPEKLPEMLRGAAGVYRGLRRAFTEARDTVQAEVTLLEREINRDAEPGPSRRTSEIPHENRADEHTHDRA